MKTVRAGLALAAAGVTLTVAAAAQQGIDRNVLALTWARGQYRAPLTCIFDGEPVRGMRRVTIGPGSRNVRPPVARLVFVELLTSEAERCFTEFGEGSPNLKGSLKIRLLGISRTDTARHDFESALRRDRGFDFYIASGRLELRQIGPEGGEPRSIDYRGGVASLHEVARGSDSERLLAGFRSPRKVHLRLQNRDGDEVIELDMLLTAPR